MNRRILILSLIIFPVSISDTVFADGDLMNGKAIYVTCAACHGQNGEGLQATNSPRLSGLRESHLVLQLQKFRTGLRGANPEDIYGMQMVPIAKSLPNEQALLDVAAYIGTLQSNPPARTEMSGDPILGQQDYVTCSQCHGASGQGFKSPKIIKYSTDHGPRLSGQHDWYLIRQIQNFKARVRGTKEDKAGWYMQADVQGLHSDQVIKNVVAYIGTFE